MLRLKSIKILIISFVFLIVLSLGHKEASAMEVRDAIYYTVSSSIGGGEMANWFTDAILYASSMTDVDPILITAVMKAESGFNINALSNAGAFGAMQLMPSTAVSVGVNINNPLENILGGAIYLSYQLRRFQNWGEYAVTYAVAAYNAGPNAVINYNGVPPYSETQNYVVIVANNYQNILNLCYS